MEYLEFELPIKELVEQLEKCQIIGEESEVDVTETCRQIEKKLDDTRKDIYKNLTAWQTCTTFKTSKQTLYFGLYQSHLWGYLFRTTW